jgi:hypothetical protein
MFYIAANFQTIVYSMSKPAPVQRERDRGTDSIAIL